MKSRMLSCLYISCSPVGSEGMTGSVENGETPAATECQSLDLGTTHRLGPGKVSIGTRKRVRQKEEGVHPSRPQSHVRVLSPGSTQGNDKLQWIEKH